MENIRGNVVILNGMPISASDYNPTANTGFYYEVIRIIEGKFLFLQEHLNRLESSCKKSSFNCPNINTLKEALTLLLKTETIASGNVKLVCFQNKNTIETACYFIPHFYPSASDYKDGVLVQTYAFVRPDPTVKKWNESFRNSVNHFIREQEIYEAILLNDEGFLTEGSRSNLFFLNTEGSLITAPMKVILPGITRKYVLQICSDLNIPLVEKMLSLKEAEKMAACFITGTSPMVLPVRLLDSIVFDPQHALVREIMERYSVGSPSSLKLRRAR